MNEQPISADLLYTYPSMDTHRLDAALEEMLSRSNKKIVVLDDDPTGVQTVHHISVYTSWDKDALRSGFEETNRMFFVLTNSRSLTKAQTMDTHREIVDNLIWASRQTGKDFLLISRSDSTLRGHYPTETEVLRTSLESKTGMKFDGEIIFPFFKEGGRYTIDNVHYVKEGDVLIPAGMTEFANDKSFGYRASHLGEWCEEKTEGAFRAEDMIYISLDELRRMDFNAIEKKLSGATDFNKVIVNAVDDIDVKVFAVAFFRSIESGKSFIIRGAAAIAKVLGGVSDKTLLTKEELVSPDHTHGGIILVGSHVKKTTEQLDELRNCASPIEFIEFNQHLVLEEGGLASEVDRVIHRVEKQIKSGKTVAVYTRRDRFDLDCDDKDAQLRISVKISDAVTSIIAKLTVQPSFIVSKGGITSSDVGTKALKVRRATVMGQVKPGVPVWMTDNESKFPNMPFVIFPGNVGDVSTLRELIEILI